MEDDEGVARTAEDVQRWRDVQRMQPNQLVDPDVWAAQMQARIDADPELKARLEGLAGSDAPRRPRPVRPERIAYRAIPAPDTARCAVCWGNIYRTPPDVALWVHEGTDLAQCYPPVAEPRKSPKSDAEVVAEARRNNLEYMDRRHRLD